MPANRRLGVYSVAASARLRAARRPAPFIKLNVRLERWPEGSPPDRVFDFQGYGEVYLDESAEDILLLSPPGARASFGREVHAALDQIHDQLGWDDPTVREIVSDVAAHAGPYRLTLFRNVRAAGRSEPWATIWEADENGDLCLVEQRSRDGTVLAWRPVFFGGLMGFVARSARLLEGQIVYFRRDGVIEEQIDLPGPETSYTPASALFDSAFHSWLGRHQLERLAGDRNESIRHAAISDSAGDSYHFWFRFRTDGTVEAHVEQGGSTLAHRLRWAGSFAERDSAAGLAKAWEIALRWAQDANHSLSDFPRLPSGDIRAC